MRAVRGKGVENERDPIGGDRKKRGSFGFRLAGCVDLWCHGKAVGTLHIYIYCQVEY
jgi:hypothetical protein